MYSCTASAPIAGPEDAWRHDLVQLAILRFRQNLQCFEIGHRLDRLVALPLRLADLLVEFGLDLVATLAQRVRS